MAGVAKDLQILGAVVKVIAVLVMNHQLAE
jgi:hypothetical protein